MAKPASDVRSQTQKQSEPGPGPVGRAAAGEGSVREGRRQICGATAISGALEAGEPVRLVLHSQGELSRPVRALLERIAERSLPVRQISERELRRLYRPQARNEPLGDAARAGRAETTERSEEVERGEEVEILALVGPDPRASLPELMARDEAVWLLVGTAYPGNAGFVIRTAEVSGAAGVVIDADFDRVARRDTQRAAMRADRFLPVLFESADACVDAARRAGRRVIAVEDCGGQPPWGADLRGPVLFIVGGEEHGIPDPLLSGADCILGIPMSGFIPSYNLQAAMAVVVAERLRQSVRSGSEG